MYIKPVDDAIRDGNPIQAVIASTSVDLDENHRRLISQTSDATGLTGLIEAVLFLKHKVTPKSTDRLETQGYNGHVTPSRALQTRTPLIHQQVSVESYPHTDHVDFPAPSARPELLLFSANSPSSLKRQIQLHAQAIQSQALNPRNVAYTRAMRREALRYRAFSILRDGQFVNISNQVEPATERPRVTMIFSGQGAQWVGMGKDLLKGDEAFHRDIEKMDGILKTLKAGPTWSIKGE